MIKEALRYIVDLSEVKLQEINGGIYCDRQLIRVKAPLANEIKTTTLTALVDYLTTGFDALEPDELMVHVVSPGEVRLMGELNDDRNREAFMVCQALLPNNTHFNKFMATEEFNIMLQSSFVDNKDKDLLLKVTGLVQEKDVKEVGDDGVTQAVTIKTGVAKVNDVVVPNPVVLAPFRTFPEIEQPESKFIFRMHSGPTAALFEADGGAWRNVAMARIKTWLVEQFDQHKLLIKVIS